MSDKYAPKPDDGANAIHKLHRQLIADEQAENKKNREAAKKAPAHAPAAKPEEVVVTSPEAPGGNQAAAGAALPSQGGPAQ